MTRRRDYGAAPTPGQAHAAPAEYELVPADPVDDVPQQEPAAEAQPAPARARATLPEPPSSTSVRPPQPAQPMTTAGVSGVAGSDEPASGLTPAGIGVVVGSAVGLLVIVVTASYFAIRGDGEREAGPTLDPQPTPTTQAPGLPQGTAGATFSDGTWVVGEDIEPGVYRALAIGATEYCYWSVVAEDPEYSDTGYVEGGIPTTVVRAGDEVESVGCGTWTSVDPADLFDEELEPEAFGTGFWLVGEDIAPGWYRAAAPVSTTSPWSCSMARSEGVGGGYDSYIAYDAAYGGRPVLDLQAGQSLEVETTCGTWEPISPDELFDEVDLTGTFGDGYWLVGEDIAPGAYVTVDDLPIDEYFECSWEIYDGATADWDASLDWDYVNAGQASVNLEHGQLVTSAWCGTWELQP